MKYFRAFIIFLILFIVILSNSYSESLNSQDEVIIAMCRPLVSQIKNIEQLYEKDIIILKRIKLICIYHEHERTDYNLSFKYVKENKLNWIKFEKIKDNVELEDLFKENKWTSHFRKIFSSTDGIIFTGGMDVPPAIYGMENSLLTKATTPIRTMYESSFIFHLIGGSQNSDFIPFLETRKDYPVFGICLGAQTINIAAGGTLYQDIPTDLYGLSTIEQVLKLKQNEIHSSIYLRNLNPIEDDLAPAFHRIKLKKNNTFIRKIKEKRFASPFVLSSHHQSIKRLGKDLIVTATSMDGKIIEIIEHEKYKNVIGVQFHPEYYPLYQKGRYFKKKPEGKIDFNLREFLELNPPSKRFHRIIWKWFSQAL